MGRAGVAMAMALLLVAAGSGGARASDLLLNQEPLKPGPAMGWTFLGLSVVSFAVASNGYSEARTSLKTADTNYALYEAATTTTDALYYRRLTDNAHNRAKAFESTANGALWVGVLFAVTSYYSFAPQRLPSWSLFVTDNTINVQHRF